MFTDGSRTQAKEKAAKSPLYQGLFAYFPRALSAVADVSNYGKNKHGFEWSDKGFKHDDYPLFGLLDAALRHVRDFAVEGPVNKGDGNSQHLAQVAWGALATLERILEEEEKNVEMDDDCCSSTRS